MDVWILESAQAVALKAADICTELIQGKPDARLGLATGATPRALYAELVRRNQRGHLSFARVEAFNLLNTPALGNPNGVLGSASFGSITTAGDPRVTQLGV